MAIRKRGKDAWAVEIRIKNKKPIYKTFPTKLEAVKFELEKKKEIKSGKTTKTITDKSLLDCFHRYISENRNNKNKIIRFLNNFLKFDEIGYLYVDEIGNEELNLLIDRLRNTGRWQDSSIKSIIKIIKAILNKTVTWDYRSPKPPLKLKKLFVNPPRDRRISEEEIKQIINYFSYGDEVKNTNHLIAAIFLFAIETGMRINEILGIKKQLIDFNNYCLRIETSKNGESRTIPLSSKAEDIIKQILKSKFANYDDRLIKLSYVYFSNLFRKALADLKIENLHFHDTRHEACSRLASIPDMTVIKLAKIIGHRDLQSLMIYFNPTGKELADLVRRKDELY